MRPHEGDTPEIGRAGGLLVIKRVAAEVLWSLERHRRRDPALEAIAAAGPDLLFPFYFLRRETACGERAAEELRKSLFFRTK